VPAVPPELPADLPVVLPVPEPLPSAVEPAAQDGTPHLVVVTTYAVTPGESAPAGSVLATRYWHPRDRQWTLNYFESLEHALHLFVEESGWAVLQQQALDGPYAHELVFRAREEDFQGPRTTQELLEEVGMTPEEVEDLLDRVDPPASE
jgi:hypothetical protein